MAIKYIKEPSQKPVNWDNKEARDLFCKCANTMVMRQNNDLSKEQIAEYCKWMVDTAFRYYPTDMPEEDEGFDFPENETQSNIN